MSGPESAAAPAVPAESERRLDPRVIRLWRLTTGLRGAVFVAAVLVTEWALELPLPTGAIAFLAAVVTLVLVVMLPPMRWRAWRFSLRASDLYLRHGVLFRTSSIVPHARIQHVDTQHGPLDRWLGLASVIVYTAGTRGAMLAIPGLDGADAEALRDRLAELSGRGDAV